VRSTVRGSGRRDRGSTSDGPRGHHRPLRARPVARVGDRPRIRCRCARNSDRTRSNRASSTRKAECCGGNAKPGSAKFTTTSSSRTIVRKKPDERGSVCNNSWSPAVQRRPPGVGNCLRQVAKGRYCGEPSGLERNDRQPGAAGHPRSKWVSGGSRGARRARRQGCWRGILPPRCGAWRWVSRRPSTPRPAAGSRGSRCRS
jgi:hypothetical protein